MENCGVKMNKKIVIAIILMLANTVFGFTEMPQIEEFIWKGRIIKPVNEPDRIIIDWQTTENINEQITSTFRNSPTVNFNRGNQAVLSLDGLLGKTSDSNDLITELVTHYHRDHINIAEVKEMLENNSFQRLVGPDPMLESSMNDVFKALDEYRERMENSSEQEHALDISPVTKPLPLKFSIIGDFAYSSFMINNEIKIELFKYQEPRNANNDGLIYRITHKGVSYLLFGDFDDIYGIESLLNTPIVNEIRKKEIREERSRLNREQILINVNTLGVGADIVTTKYMFRCTYCGLYHINPASLVHLTDSAIDIAKLLKENLAMEDEIAKLLRELDSLPTISLQADVIKWPHHAHKFSDNQRARDIIIKMNDVVNPVFIIWQRHYTQIDNNFENYIKDQFEFHDKFKCSDDITFEFISFFTKRIDRMICAITAFMG